MALIKIIRDFNVFCIWLVEIERFMFCFNQKFGYLFHSQGISSLYSGSSYGQLDTEQERGLPVPRAGVLFLVLYSYGLFD